MLRQKIDECLTKGNYIREYSSVVSMFSGCGGMDLGFRGGFDFHGRHYKRLPYDIVWANDNDGPACSTYRKNLGSEIHHGDVTEVIDSIPEAADVIIGGFPCQDVSINGRRAGEAGGRTILYRHMVNAIREIKPAAFVAENVKGLLLSTAQGFYRQMLGEFEGAGKYNVTAYLVSAADYEVPQRRERIFIVGVQRPRTFTFPPSPILTQVTAQEALRDLEDCPEDRGTAHIWSRAARSPDQGDRTLRPDLPATTIRAEHHGNSQWHYRLPRRISLREAARLQSFPDSFEFPGGMRQTERQIGNAVPPVLAWHIALELASII